MDFGYGRFGGFLRFVELQLCMFLGIGRCSAGRRRPRVFCDPLILEMLK